MRKTGIILIISMLIFASGCKTGKKNKENIKFDQVSEEYFFPEQMRYNQGVTDVLPDKFYPIGWSKHGNFAYIIEPADEGLGNYQMGIVIMNMVSNEVLWDWYTKPEVTKDLYREDIWQKHYKNFKQMLNKYGIIQQRHIKLTNPYFTYKKKDYTIKLQTTTTKNKDMGIDVITQSQIYLKSPQLGQKQIAQKQYPASMIIGQQIAGCIISPFEDRIAVIVKSERWGYEGPPDVVEFQLFGANLSTGFKK
jgi:hypothetical protein